MLTIKCDFCGVVQYHESEDMYVMRLAPRSVTSDPEFYDICKECVHRLTIKAAITRKAFQLEDCDFNEEGEDDE